MKIEGPVDGGLVRITVPCKEDAWFPFNLPGEYVYLVDPRKGFMPVQREARKTPAKPDAKEPAEAKFTVEESKLFGDIWMPTRMINKEISGNKIGVVTFSVNQLEFGGVKPSDLLIPFPQGMKVQDFILGVEYVADEDGKASPPIKAMEGQRKPPADWKTSPNTLGISFASVVSPENLKLLEEDRAAKKKERDTREAPLDVQLKVLQADPPVAEEKTNRSRLGVASPLSTFRSRRHLGDRRKNLDRDRPGSRSNTHRRTRPRQKRRPSPRPRVHPARHRRQPVDPRLDPCDPAI